jgi:hypothetical protein
MAVGKKAKIKGPIKGDMDSESPFKVSLDSKTRLCTLEGGKGRFKG